MVVIALLLVSFISASAVHAQISAPVPRDCGDKKSFVVNYYRNHTSTDETVFSKVLCE